MGKGGECFNVGIDPAWFRRRRGVRGCLLRDVPERLGKGKSPSQICPAEFQRRMARKRRQQRHVCVRARRGARAPPPPPPPTRARARPAVAGAAQAALLRI